LRSVAPVASSSLVLRVRTSLCLVCARSQVECVHSWPVRERRRSQCSDFIDIRIDTHDVWRHHELNIETLVAVLGRHLLFVLLCSRVLWLPLWWLRVVPNRGACCVPVWFLAVVLIEPLAAGDIVFELRLPKRLIELRILRVLRVWGLHSSLSRGCIVVWVVF